MEELLTYYPEHVLHWPGLAILYNHYRFRLTNSIFEDTFQYVKTVRGDHIDISKRSFRRATKRTGMQILNGYDAGSFDGHMQPLSEAVQASGQSLEAFLESILWTTPKGIALQPVVPLSDVGSTVLTHPVGQFSSRVVAAMQNQTSPHPPNKHGITSLPIIKRCLHGSPEVDETMRETISLNYYPVHLPEKFVIQHYYAQLIHEPLLYVLIKYSGNAIAHMVPAEVCPDQTHAGFKTFAAKLRKRQQMALGQRGERREILWKGMTKIVYGEAYGKLKKEYQEERICGGYGGVRAPAKRKDYEEEEENENEDEDETSRPAPSGKRRRTKKGKFGGQQGMNVMNAYATSRPSTYGGTHLPTPSFLSTLATPSMQRTQIPWAAGITQQELGFHAPTTFQNNPPSRTFTAARLNTGLESVYDRPAAQYYDQQIGSSGQQPTFQGPNYNTFDFSAGDDPQYHSTSDLFGHSQYDNPQPSNGVGENDMGFNSFPRNHDAAPQFIHPSIKGNIVEEEHFGEDAIVLPEITLEDWDQMINFENYGHQHTPTTVSITPIALNDLANSAVQFPPPYPNPNIHHATEPQYPTIPIPTPPHLSNTEISQVSPQPPPPNQYREPSFQSAPHKSPPYQQEQERYESIPPPSIDDNEIYGGETTPTKFEDLIDEFYATNADVDIHVDINIELEPPSKATSDKEHHGSNDAINAGNIGKWFNATQHPDETISNNETIPQTNLDNPMEREGKKRNASITSTDSLASLFGEETGR
ncbi:hypothetical protein E6O75_ATG05351 [Venturia nashicola]|uniref:Uncharacterized protein n=1 Tax=Venturia nashicola TaxID=86259 RepID=A0A4Z1NX42_9PEZI|nr:hypothetical protein E6O75_ATG05351 [Venturia nashicola]